MFIEGIKYPDQSKCNMSGNDILLNLFFIAKYKLHLDTIDLFDESMLKSLIPLKNYSILLNGESWYNKYGYKSDQYDKEQTYNYNIIHNKIKPKLIEQINNIDDTILPTLNYQNTVNEVMIQLNYKLKTELVHLTKTSHLYQIIALLIVSYPIKYNSVLSLDLNDDKIANLYHKQIKNNINTELIQNPPVLKNSTLRKLTRRSINFGLTRKSKTHNKHTIKSIKSNKSIKSIKSIKSNKSIQKFTTKTPY